MLKSIRGEVVGVYSATDQEQFVTFEEAELSLTINGIDGDRHCGSTTMSNGRMTYLYKRGTEVRNSRQLSLVSTADLLDIARGMEVKSIKPQWLGANVLLTNIPSLTQMPPGVRLFFHGQTRVVGKRTVSGHESVLVAEGENLPCTGPGEIIGEEYADPTLASKFPKAALHKRGITAWVEKPGLICIGDMVEVVIPPNLKFFMEQLPYFK